MPTFREQIKTVQDDRNKIVVDARKITDTAIAAKRELTAEENVTFDTMMADVDAMGAKLKKLTRMAEAEDSATADVVPDLDADGNPIEEPRAAPPAVDTRTGPKTPPGAGTGAAPTHEMRGAWETEQEFRTRRRRSTPEYRHTFLCWLADGASALSAPRAQRAISADADIVGGYMVAPQEWVTDLIKFVDNILWIRQRATKFTVKAAQSLGAPSLDVDVADADWTSELDTGTEDTSMAFGKRELTPKPLAKRLKVSNKLLRMAAVSGGKSADGSVPSGGAEGLVKSRLGYKFGVSQEKAFMTGNGSYQPLGLFTASTRGISTGRDYSTDMTTSNVTADGLIGAKYTMKPQYWGSLEWLFHRDMLAKIRKLKDGNGQYLWVPSGMGNNSGFSYGVDGGKLSGDTLLDCPVLSSEYVPNTFTTGQYVGMLGDYSFYWIADSEMMTIQRLVELYAASNQTGFIARQEIDGMPVLEEAFVRIKLA